MITLNGITSDSLGITVDGYSFKPIAKRRVESQHIPGRNGDLLIDEGVYDNYTQSYTIYWLPSTSLASISQWLNQSGYVKLIDSDLPEYYRMAQVSGPINPTNHRDCYTEASVSFNCKPQWFLVSGDVTKTLNAATNIVNPTTEYSRPLIVVYGTGDGVLKVNGENITLTSINTSITLDSELMEASVNSKMSGNFPTLKPGNNSIDWSGGITKVDITPRWWIA